MRAAGRSKSTSRIAPSAVGPTASSPPSRKRKTATSCKRSPRLDALRELWLSLLEEGKKSFGRLGRSEPGPKSSGFTTHGLFELAEERATQKGFGDGNGVGRQIEQALAARHRSRQKLGTGEDLVHDPDAQRRGCVEGLAPDEKLRRALQSGQARQKKARPSFRTQAEPGERKLEPRRLGRENQITMQKH